MRDTPELRMKSGFRAVVDNFEGVDMLLTPSQSVVFRNIRPAQKAGVEVSRAVVRVVIVRIAIERRAVVRRAIVSIVSPPQKAGVEARLYTYYGSILTNPSSSPAPSPAPAPAPSPSPSPAPAPAPSPSPYPKP